MIKVNILCSGYTSPILLPSVYRLFYFSKRTFKSSTRKSKSFFLTKHTTPICLKHLLALSVVESLSTCFITEPVHCGGEYSTLGLGTASLMSVLLYFSGRFSGGGLCVLPSKNGHGSDE
ncbi:hypothetical protein NC651_018084 [Populus alba x Populus x berolinensis]|nr:hypothetical protein NC651_018084 [Populus alba x Populus x berolinensis]